MKRDFDGITLLVEGYVRDTAGNPIAGATLDIWQTAPNGMYSSQDPDQDIHSFHALMTTDQNGRYAFTTARPVSYTVPYDGPVGRSCAPPVGIPGARPTCISSSRPPVTAPW